METNRRHSGVFPVNFELSNETNLLFVNKHWI